MNLASAKTQFTSPQSNVDTQASLKKLLVCHQAPNRKRGHEFQSTMGSSNKMATLNADLLALFKSLDKN